MAKAHIAAKDAVYQGMRNFKEAIMAEIECAQISKVINYDDKKHVADIQPLAVGPDGQQSAQYLDVPVSANCYLMDELIDSLKSGEDWLNKHGISLPNKKLMKKGAIVVTVVLDNDSTNWDGSGNTFETDTSRLHDANDAIVIGVLGGDIF